MHVGLLNLYSTDNLGDAAIYSSLARLSPSGIVAGAIVEAHGTPTPGLMRLPSRPRCDAYISVGGDIFNNARPALVTRRFLSNLAETSRDAQRTMVFGQSIPPSCRGLAMTLLSGAFRRLAAVVVRDEESYARLRAHSVDALLSYDVVFTADHTLDESLAARDLFDAAGLDPDRTAVISLRNSSRLYSGAGDATEQALGDLATKLLARGHQVALMLQAKEGEWDSDLSMAARLQSAIPGVAILDPFSVSEPHVPWQVLRSALAMARLTVAVRYHTAVLRMSAGRQSFVLPYSNKSEDLAKRLRQPAMSLKDAGSDEAVILAESSIDRSFDVAPIAQHVRQAFKVGLEAATGVRVPA